MRPLRNSAKAIIVENERILLTKNIDGEGFFYLFPGGGQEIGEPLHDTVIRECMEEIGQQVTVSDLVHVREYIGKNHGREADFDFHQVEFYFACTRVPGGGGPEPGNGAVPDDHQVGVEWIAIAQLEETRVYPRTIIPYLQGLRTGRCYLGDAN